jgi:S1-C subfamily serine protease
LCDLDGRVIGVNTLINGINSGLAFAIPSALAREVSDELIARGRITRPWLGIIIRTLGDAPDLHGVFGRESGVIVTSLPPDGPAASSRLRPADVIVEVDGEPVETSRELQQKVLRKKVGQKVDLKVWRRGAGGDGAFLTVPVTTGELPAGDAVAAASADTPPSRPPGRSSESPLFGLEVQALTGRLAGELGVAEGGVIVTYVEPDSAAELAGLKVRDIITSVGPQAVSDPDGFAAALAGLKPKEAVVLNIERGGQKTYAILQK